MEYKTNYHCHTKRCNHASGEDEQYVLNAIEAGFKEIGFTDHVILPAIDRYDMVRAPYSMLDDYLSSIRNLQKKYKNKIKIYLGFECEYHKSFESYYHMLLDTNKVDYLILGNHQYIFEKGEFKNFLGDREENVKRYVRNAIKAMKTGMFSILAHPDLFMLFSYEWTSVFEQQSILLCKAAKKYNVPLEINCGCLRENIKCQMGKEYRIFYPYDKFWKIVKKVGNEVVVGLDCHNPNHYLDDSYKHGHEYAEKMGITVSDRFQVVRKLKNE